MGIVVVKKPKKNAKQRSLSNKEVSIRTGNTRTISKDPNFASQTRNKELAGYNKARGKVVKKLQKRAGSRRS